MPIKESQEPRIGAANAIPPLLILPKILSLLILLKILPILILLPLLSRMIVSIDGDIFAR